MKSEQFTAIELSVTDLTHDGHYACTSAKTQQQTWDGHPRVFLNLAETGHAKCPYCGAQYQLKAGEVFAAHH